MRLAPPPMCNEEAELRAWLRKFSTDRPRWGWRRAAKMVIIEGCRRDYNDNRRHTTHGELTPTEFVLQLTTTHQSRVA